MLLCHCVKEDDSAKLVYIKTVYRLGYILEVEDKDKFFAVILLFAAVTVAVTAANIIRMLFRKP